MVVLKAQYSPIKVVRFARERGKSELSFFRRMSSYPSAALCPQCGYASSADDASPRPNTNSRDNLLIPLLRPLARRLVTTKKPGVAYFAFTNGTTTDASYGRLLLKFIKDTLTTFSTQITAIVLEIVVASIAIATVLAMLKVLLM